MEYKGLEKTDRKTTQKPSNFKVNNHTGKADQELSSLKKGQLITGTVVSVGNEVTIDLYGHSVAAAADVFVHVKPGETKNFEVEKVTGREITLKLLDQKAENNCTFMVSLTSNADWDAIMAQKEQSAIKAGRETEDKDTADMLEDIGQRLTEQDCALLEKEGFSPEDYTVKGLYEALNRIKSVNTQSAADQKKATGENANLFDKTFLEKSLKEANLPATKENVEKLQKALSLCETAGKMDDKAMKNLILTGAEPTLENIYKAYYSGTIQSRSLSEAEWDDLKSQAAKVIWQAGYEVSEENLKTARWLIENKLPLTAETFSYKKELEDIKDSAKKEKVLDRLIEGMKQGVNPEDIPLLSGNSGSAEVLAKLQSIQPEAITYAVRSGTVLTIKNLAAIQKSLEKIHDTQEQAAEPKASASDSFDEADGADNRYEEIRARRQLEEIRLKMTLEAAAQLEQRGFKVETRELSRVVDALKELEDSSYKRYLQEADAEVTEASLELLKETTRSIGQLKSMPEFVLGSTPERFRTQTIPELLTEGRNLQAQLDKAGAAYETLMTVPNREYGDSIQKAFDGMDSLLSELHIENTQQNQRAVRILAYNRMEINEEAINRVKAYDLQVTSLIKNLQPAVTVRMIKEGINPLNMPIPQLNDRIDRIKEEQGISSEDKFSTFLLKLEKENAISDQERKAYIGIYRLLYNVDKTDGAALGAVIKSGREVTLDNLLTAVQTLKKGKLDLRIDEEFGILKSISHDKETISEQLDQFFGNAENQSPEDHSGDTPDQTEYLNRIIKQIKEELSPDKLKEAQKNLLQAGGISSQAGASAQSINGSQPLLSSSRGIWETIKKVPVEELLEKLAAMQGEETDGKDMASAKVQEIRELCKNAEQAIRFLNDYKLPGTPINLLIANHILSNGESPVRKLLRLQEENIVGKSKNSLKEISELTDKLVDRQTMEEAYTQLETDADSELKRICSEEIIDSRKIAELKNLGQQLGFARRLAEREFYQIPVETGSGMTNINLTILRGEKTSGRLSVSIRSEKLGNVKADFRLKDKVLKGFVSSDSRAGLEELQKNTDFLEAAAEESDVTLKQLDFALQQKEAGTYSFQSSQEKSDLQENPDTERILYRIAKAVVRTVCAA